MGAADKFGRYVAPAQMSKPRRPRVDTALRGPAIEHSKPFPELLAAGYPLPAAVTHLCALNLTPLPNRYLGRGERARIGLVLHLAGAECKITLHQLLTCWPAREIEGRAAGAALALGVSVPGDGTSLPPAESLRRRTFRS